MKYLIRHCESLRNIHQTDEWDCELSQNGFIQAAELQKQFIWIDLPVISSPYLRCRQTARYINKNYITDNRLVEYGAKHLETLRSGLNVFRESDQEIINRLENFAFEYKDKDIIVVTHGTPLMILEQLFKGQNLTTIPAWDSKYKNGVIIKI